MIPKVIHYCWFGGKPLPPLADKCIASWKKFFPDYEIKRWDESNFDVNSTPYTREAYEAKKYAFVSDYARFVILYELGGIYFDTDVEVIRPMDDIISAGPFMGCEASSKPSASPISLGVAPGLGLGVNPGHSLYKEIINMYSTLHFRDNEGALITKTVVEHTTEFLVSKGLVNTPDIQEIEGIKIYPSDYFCPLNIVNLKLEITPRTATIHHYAGSWASPWDRMKKRLQKLLGPAITTSIQRIKHTFVK